MADELVRQGVPDICASTPWPASRAADSAASTLGARLTSRRMPLPAPRAFAVLAALDERGELSQAELGRNLGLDRNDVNVVVTRLHDAGAVQRGPDPTDRRRNIVEITPLGEERLQELDGHAAEVQDELLAALSPTERAHLSDLMLKVLSAQGMQTARRDRDPKTFAAWGVLGQPSTITTRRVVGLTRRPPASRRTGRLPSAVGPVGRSSWRVGPRRGRPVGHAGPAGTDQRAGPG